MRCIPLATLALVALATIVPAQPCVFVPFPLALGPNPGDTSLSAIIGTGLGDPFFPPVSCSFYGFNDSPEDWYEWVAPVSGTLDLTTCPGIAPGASGFDTSIAVWSGVCPGPLAFEACNGDGPAAGCPGFTSFLSLPVVGGTTYWIKLNGYDSFSLGAYVMVAAFTPAVAPFTLAFTGGAGTLNIDLTDGPPGVDYFTAASFDGTNATFPGSGWFFGLHISLNDLVIEHQIALPPFRGVLDGSGAATFTLLYPPALTGVMLWGVSVVDGGPGLPFDSTAVATFTF